MCLSSVTTLRHSGCRKTGEMTKHLFFATICFAITAAAQEPASEPTSAKHDVGTGAGDIGESAAKGTGKAAGDLVTLHPVDGATDLGKGAAGAGKHVGVGAAKGTAKILK